MLHKGVGVIWQLEGCFNANWVWGMLLWEVQFGKPAFKYAFPMAFFTKHCKQDLTSLQNISVI